MIKRRKRRFFFRLREGPAPGQSSCLLGKADLSKTGGNLPYYELGTQRIQTVSLYLEKAAAFEKENNKSPVLTYFSYM